jgi:riboflavin synthase alpha subunit
MKMKEKLKAKLKSERGDVSIKGIALTVAAIVLIGFAISIINGNLSGWISQVWQLFMDQIESLIS